jgi:hypothetical protein
MLLVLASPNDQTAIRFAAYARASGAPCLITDQVNSVDLRVAAERDGRTISEIRFPGESAPVEGVLSRVWAPVLSSTSDSQFQAAETLACWWSVLACFPGPVINRPSRTGFVPNLDLSLLNRSDSNIQLAPVCLGTSPPIHSADSQLNVHRVRDGQFIGRISSDTTVSLNEDELHIFTQFDPLQTIHVLLAGNRVFDLSNERGQVAPTLEAQLLPILAQLQARNATFSFIVLQRDTMGVRLLHASPFPGVHHYRHIESQVHEGLLEYLTS